MKYTFAIAALCTLSFPVLAEPMIVMVCDTTEAFGVQTKDGKFVDTEYSTKSEIGFGVNADLKPELFTKNKDGEWIAGSTYKTDRKFERVKQGVFKVTEEDQFAISVSVVNFGEKTMTHTYIGFDDTSIVSANVFRCK